MSEERKKRERRPRRRRRRRRKSEAEKAVDEVTGFIEDNPVASAVAALAAGAVAASVFKIVTAENEGDDETPESGEAG
jgi:hypothetical protein